LELQWRWYIWRHIQLQVVGLVYLAAYLHLHQVFYSILVDRFANGDITNDNSNLTMVVVILRVS